MISVLCPTRMRVRALSKSINSLLDTADSPDEIELLFAFDEDDKKNAEKVQKMFEDSKVQIHPRYGYKQLHKYYNALAEASTGEWLFIWNDDAVMTTQGWDTQVRSHDGEMKLLHIRCEKEQDSNESVFPIIPRKYYEVLEHISLNAHNDTWIWQVMSPLGLVEELDARIRHERADLTGDNEDAVYQQRDYQTRDFNKMVEDGLVQADQLKIKNLL